MAANALPFTPGDLVVSVAHEKGPIVVDAAYLI
jgi:hypothetical protein